MEPGSVEWIRSRIDDLTATTAANSFEQCDPSTRLALLVKVLTARSLAVDVRLEHLTLAELEEFAQHRGEVLPEVAVGPGRALESGRIGLRAARPDDIDLIYDVVNDPEVSWRLPTRGRYVSPEQITVSLVNDSELLTIAYERASLRPVTVLALTSSSDLHRVAELSFYSLRNSSDRVGAQSMEALACFLSHCFNRLSMRKIVGAIPSSGFPTFAALEDHVFVVEGVRRDHVRVGDRFEDLVLVAVWAETWRVIEPVLARALANWET